MAQSWQKSPKDYAERAIKVVRDLVAAHRESGMKTLGAIDEIAPQLEIQPRRVRRLFERDRDPLVGFDEYSRILLRGARILRRVADRLRECADRWEAEADLLELQHRQLTLWGNGECVSRGEGRQSRRAA